MDLDRVFADDTLVDAIAARPWGAAERNLFTGGVDGWAGAGAETGALLTLDPLTELLESWRDELAVTPMPSAPDALGAPVRNQRRPSNGRRLRPALAVAAAIAALLVGSASIGSKDAPRDSVLFAITQVLWPSRAQSVASADEVQAALVEARSALDDGRAQDAQLALLRATVELGQVQDVDGRSGMQLTVAALWVQAAPQGLPAITSASDFDSLAQPAGTPTRSAGATQTAQSPADDAADAVGSGQLAAPTVAVAGPAQPTMPWAAASQAALSPGRPSASQEPAASAASIASATSPVATPAATPPPVDPTSAGPTVVDTTAQLPSTPSPPTAPASTPAQVVVAEPPSAPEQSAPSPTPSVPANQVDPSAASSADSLSDASAAGANSVAGNSVATKSVAAN